MREERLNQKTKVAFFKKYPKLTKSSFNLEPHNKFESKAETQNCQSINQNSPVNFLSIQVGLQKENATNRLSKLVLPAPLSVCYSIINKCDRHCGHCMSSSTEEANLGLSTEKVKNLLETLKNSGVLRVDIVGGEPFIRNDLLDIVKYAVENLELEITITTHGGFVTEENAETLASLGIIVQVSLDGPSETNDKLRGKGSYQKAIEGIKILVNKSVPVRISCTIQKTNQDVV